MTLTLVSDICGLCGRGGAAPQPVYDPRRGEIRIRAHGACAQAVERRLRTIYEKAWRRAIRLAGRRARR